MSAKRKLGRPVEADGEATRRRIMDVAMRHLSESGYARTTLKNVARDAGITSGAIYHYFESKPALVSALLSETRQYTLEHTSSLDLENLSSSARFVQFLRSSAAIYVERPELAPFATQLLGDALRYAELDDEFRRSNLAMTGFYRGLVDEAELQALPDGVDRQALTDLFAAITFGMASIATRSREGHELAVDATEALLTGRLVRRRRVRRER